MSDITRWVLVDTTDTYVGTDYGTYRDAVDAARKSPEPVAVVELTYSLDDSALVWTPEGGERATMLTWPPADDAGDEDQDDEDEYDHSRAKEDARNAALAD